MNLAAELGPDKRIAIIAPDGGGRYLSTALFGGSSSLDRLPHGP
jgi:hypothetical protein